MTLKSLDTKYAGCLFRSRLEARWAVWLDHLGIDWEYEPQGYEVTNRLNLDAIPDTFRYLPDFWLPGLRIWFEVKGELDDPRARARLLSQAASLSNEDGGCTVGRADLAVAGRLTSPNSVGMPILLHMHKGDLVATCMLCGQHTQPAFNVANDCGTDYGQDLLRGFYCGTHAVDPAILAAFDAARTARFEHGRKPKNVEVRVP